MMASLAPSPAVAPRIQKLEVRPIRAALGAEIVCADIRALDEDAIKVLYQAYLDHLVLLVRGQTLSDDDLLELGEKFGELEAGSARLISLTSSSFISRGADAPESCSARACPSC